MPKLLIANQPAQKADIGGADAVVVVEVERGQRADIDAENIVLGQAFGQARVQAVNAFDEDGLILRCGADYDARRKNLKLTEKAQHLSQEIQAGITEFEAVLTAGFTEEERRELLRLIRKVETNVDAASQGKPSPKGERLC